MGRLATLLIVAVFIGMLPSSASYSVDLEPRQAPYKPPKVGTVLFYDNWKCTILESEGHSTVCADTAKSVQIYAGLVLHGPPVKDGYAGALAEVECDPIAKDYTSFSIGRTWIEPEQKKAIAALWPLKKGKSAAFHVRTGSSGTEQIDYELNVVDVETAKVGGHERSIYVIKGTANFPECDGEGKYEQTWWYDRVQGVVVRSKRVWVRGIGHDFDYRLKRIVFPGAPRQSPAISAGQTPAVVIKSNNPPRRVNSPRFFATGKSEANSLVDVDFGRYHALVIGINAYQKLSPLKTAAKDARSIGKILEQKYGFKTNLILDATRENIIDTLALYRARLTFNDSLLIYYAGHGVIDEVTQRGYWLPADAAKHSPSNWISVNDVTAMILAIRAHHVLIVSDSCYSGTLIRAAPVRLRTANDRTAWIKRMLQKRARTALTSGGLEPVLDGGGDGHSVFARAFLTALTKNNGVLDGQSLFDLIKRPVALNSSQTPQYSDIRFAGHQGGDFLFVRRRN